MTSCTVHRLAEQALLCSVPPPASLEAQRRIWAMAARAADWRGVVDVVPGMNNLMVIFDEAADVAALERNLKLAWASGEASQAIGRLVEIPVRYGGEHGPDLADVAAHTGLSPQEVVRRHSAGEYVVYFLGFQPGFAYMGGLAPELATPRRREPRLAVPAGSVGIGGEQTGIYPASAPGGWQLIGHTDAALFVADRDPPSLFAPGDTVRFVAEEVIA
ncbi:5-oxoprolinase subunit B [Cupriavidus yeoncheonensis]|uniref:5-oxoprolinase subunit B n=1 Tax=Cupriavidus yeoncheonensis TaxID=1462994 RepID=A0A916IRW6_9BURK|nr:5-oxoprolinase subunit PxpB [Cupriavidus yeoncheonensis]CAG2131834.1 5-oxoprolinase subunit B [Cupriavidus yeoncheonensis]